MIEVSVNDKYVSVAASATVAEALLQWGYKCTGVAVAINGEFVPRANYAEQGLRAGDRVDVVAPMAGG